MTQSHTLADYRNAEDVLYGLRHGDLIEFTNCAPCEHQAGCSEVIEWVDSDIDGPDDFQPQGLKCACGNWACNEHAVRSEACCLDCWNEGAP